MWLYVIVLKILFKVGIDHVYQNEYFVEPVTLFSSEIESHKENPIMNINELKKLD